MTLCEFCTLQQTDGRWLKEFPHAFDFEIFVNHVLQYLAIELQISLATPAIIDEPKLLGIARLFIYQVHNLGLVIYDVIPRVPAIETIFLRHRQ